MSTQNVNVARFAKVNATFWAIFKHCEFVLTIEKGAFLKIFTLAPLILKILKETRAKKKKYEPFFWCTLESKFLEEELQYFYCYTISSFFFFFFSCVFWAQKCWLQLRRGRIEWFTVSQCWICFVGYPLCHTHWK